MARTEVYKEIKSIVNPGHSALVVWDVQNLLVGRIFNKEEFLENNRALIKKAHELKIPVIFTKITPLPEKFESSPRLARGGFPKDMDKSMLELSIEAEADDIVLNKNTASIFIGTNFELMMRNAGIETLIFTGIATEIGVESSVRDSSNRGFYNVVVKDAVSSGNRDAHERSLQNMELMFNVIPTKELLTIWKK